MDNVVRLRMPEDCPLDFLELSIDKQVDWLLKVLMAERCSAAWVMERLQHLGLVPNVEAYMQGREVLMGAYAYYGSTPIEKLREELTELGIRLR